MTNPVTTKFRAWRLRVKQWCLEHGLEIDHPEENALLKDELRPLKELILWWCALFNRLMVSLAGLSILFGALKLTKVHPFVGMTWWRALSPLWAGVPIAFIADIIIGVLAIAVLAFALDDRDDDDDEGGHPAAPNHA